MTDPCSRSGAQNTFFGHVLYGCICGAAFSIFTIPVKPDMDSVVLETSMGDIQIELYWDHAPKVSLETAWSTPIMYSQYPHSTPDLTLPSPTDVQEFRRALQERILQWCHIPPNHRRACVFEALVVFERAQSVSRCRQDFMVQGGDPTGTGRGGTSIYGQRLYVSHPIFSELLVIVISSSFLT